MATKHTKIKRAITEFKYFLEYYQNRYNDASKYIVSGQGWNIPYYENELYELVANMYGCLYETIHPKLFEENPATDEEILNDLKSSLEFLEKSNDLFNKIIDKSQEKVLSSVEGIVQELLIKAVYKLKEVIVLAEFDLEKSQKPKSNKNIEIGIVVATDEEQAAVLNLFNTHKINSSNQADSSIYYEGIFKKNEKKIKVVLVKTSKRMPAAATITTKLILKYNLKYIFMVGHLAGNKNRKDKHHLGDIIIGDKSVDYQQLEIIDRVDGPNKVGRKNDKDEIPVNSALKNKLDAFIQEEQLKSIKESYPNNKLFSHPLKAHIGKIISGSALMRSDEEMNTILSENDKTFGLDMETYGFYYACQHVLADTPKFVSIKSISDYGEKDGKYEIQLKPSLVRQKYACFTSAKFLYEFILGELYNK